MTTSRNAILLALPVLAMPFLAQAQTNGTCTNATLTGAYSITISGRNVSSTAVLSSAYQAVGTATFDGVSKVTFNLTASTNQQPLGTSVTQSGTYSLPSNCVGTLSITTGDTASYTLIPWNKGLSFNITGQDATYSLSGTGGNPPTSCLVSTFSGAWNFNGNGYSLGSSGITGVNSIAGLFQFDGAGSITGTWSVTTNGASTNSTVSGHYSVSGCTANATLTDQNGLAYTMPMTMSLVSDTNPTTTTTTTSPASLGGTLGSQTALFTVTLHAIFGNPELAVGNVAGTGGITPGTPIAIYGTGMVNGSKEPVGSPLPPTIDSASVTINGEMAPIYYASNLVYGIYGLINVQVPYDIQPGLATLVVQNGSTASNAVSITVSSTPAPGLVVYPTATTANHVVAQNFPSFATNSEAAPAPTGSTIIVYFTAGGSVNAQSLLATGTAVPTTLSSTQESTVGTCTATINGVAATVSFCGVFAEGIGGYQANIVVPKVAAGDHPLILTVGGKASSPAMVSVSSD